jgi:hypothetical protein
VGMEAGDCFCQLQVASHVLHPRELTSPSD